MSRRGLFAGILLLCILLSACSSRDESNSGITAAYDTMESNRKPGEIFTADGDSENIIMKENELQSNNYIEVEKLTEAVVKEEVSENPRRYPAGSVIDLQGAQEEYIQQLFYIEELSTEVIARIDGKSYGNGCDIPYEELRYIRVLHHGFDGSTRIGELIVNKMIAQPIIDIFRDLYEQSYPIEKLLLIDDYDAEDNRSMEENNSSAFNYRNVAGTNRLSKHSLGYAIDINPLYNPYITKIDGKKTILPENAAEYEDRTMDNPYFIHKDDVCYRAFIDRGFTWGGDWKNSKDYQHFQWNP